MKNEIMKEKISEWIKGIYECKPDIARIQLKEDIFLETEWNYEKDEKGYECVYLDIMVTNAAGDWLIPYSTTSYTSQDHEQVAEGILRSIGKLLKD